MSDVNEADGDELGTRFWLGLIGFVIAGGLCLLIVFVFFSWAWYSWGLLGALIVISAVALAFGYLYDRREQRRRSRITA